MEPVAHDLPARARQLESLARMACLSLKISYIKKPSTLSSIECDAPNPDINIDHVSNFVLIFISHQHKREKRFGSRPQNSS
jgi:hypothetical protein